MNIFILAGGFGTRLRSVVSDVPKPMAFINEEPFLEYQIKNIRMAFPLNTIYLLTYYKSEVIEKYYENQKNIKVIKESKPLGTGGSVVNAIRKLGLKSQDSLLVFNGDTYLEVDLLTMIDSSKYDLTILSSLQEDCSRYGTLEIKNDTIFDFKEKVEVCKNSYINAGCYYFKSLEFFNDDYKLNSSFSLELQFEKYVKKNKIGVMRYESIFIDIGIPEDYEKMKFYIGSERE